MNRKPTYEELEQRILELEKSESELLQAEERVEKERSLFKAIVDRLPLMLTRYDPKANMLFLNKEFERLVGWKTEEVQNIDMMEKVYPDPEYRQQVYKYMLKASSEWRKFNVQSRSGKIIESEWSNIRLDDGTQIGIGIDVTEKKKAEKELHKIKSLLDATGRMALVGGWELDANTNELTWTDETYRIHEITIGSKPSLQEAVNFFHPEDRPQLEQAIQQALNHGEPYDMEIRFITAKGNHLWTRTICRPFIENGKVIKLKGTFQDITERKQSESSLKAIEWLIETSPSDDYQSTQHYGDLTELNTERTILGNIGSEVLGDIVKEYLELLSTSAAVYERNGDYALGIFSSGWCRMLDAASRRLCSTDDNATALSSGKWLCHESCWKNASEVSIKTGEPVDIECHGGIRLYAVPIETGGKAIGSINFGYGDPPKNIKRIEEIAGKYQINPKALLNEAEKYESRPKFIVEIAKKRLKNSAKLIGALVESKITQAELQQERERLHVTLRSIGDGVITTDIDGKVMLLNNVAETLTGWKQKEAIDKKIEKVFHIVNEHTREICENPVEKVLETGGIIGLANDTLLLARNGTERVIADSGAPIVDSDGNTVGVVLVFRDITEKVKLETELHHAHKMEAIGNLAGGIAHEFNNVLGIIIGNTELATDDLEEWHPVYENLSEIKLASLRAKDVVKQLLSFSRKMDIKRAPIDISIVVKESLKLLRASIPSAIRIKENLSEDIDTVVADPTQIHQVLINLCNNAAQAMSEEGGSLTIELNNVVLDYEAASKQPGLKPGDYVRFSVSDTGHGIPPDMLDKIFDPYFTTKDIGKGTGMGLAVVHGIVKTHNGAINVDSTIGKGTAFHVYFPSSKDKVHHKKIKDKSLPRGKERILFVDDEVSIGKLCAQILEKLDYKVSSDSDPMQTLERFRSDPNAFDLVISDMTMPNLTGDRLAQELLKIRPDIPIVICTGFSEKISLEKAHQLGIKSFLMKPVEQADLANTVRQVLDEAKGIKK